MAGVLSAGNDACVDGPAAGRLRGVWTRGSDEVHVRVDRGTRPRAVPGFVFHRAPVPNTARIELPGGAIPVVGFVAMCERLARTLTRWQLASVIARGIYERAVRLTDLERAAAVRARAPWITVLRAAIRLVRSGSVGTRGATEDRLLARLLLAGVRPPIVNTRGAMGLSRDEPDFYWREERLNVEVDGGQHDESAQAADDATRDAEVESMGIVVIRVRARDVWRRPNRVVAAVQAALQGDAVRRDSRRYVQFG